MFQNEKWTEEKLVDVRDALLELLRSFKLLVAVAVIAAAVFVGWGIYSFHGQSQSASKEKEVRDEEKELEKMVDLAVSKITENEREEVELVYDQLSTYQKYRKSWVNIFNSDLTYGSGGEESRAKRMSYLLSSTIKGVTGMFTTMALGPGDYQKIAELNPSIETVSAAYDYVNVNVISGNEIPLTNMGESEATILSQYILNVDIIGDTKKTCDAVGEIVDEAFQKELELVRKVDKNAELALFDVQYRDRMFDYIVEKQQSRLDTLQKIDTMINSIRVNRVDKLTAPQKEYYTILSDLDKARMTAAAQADNSTKKKFNLLQNVALGLLVGFLFASLVVIIRYLASGKVKLNKEIEKYYQLYVLDTFFFPVDNRGVLQRLIGALSHADSRAGMVKARSVAADLCGLLDRTDTNGIYLARTCSDEEDEELAAAIIEAIQDRDQGCAAASGMPLERIKDLENMIGRKNTVLLIHNRQTAQSDLEKLVELCARHSINLLGAVTIVDL